MILALRRRPASPNWRGQEGQTIILVAIGLGLFLLALIGLCVDFSNFWFHRQTAQGAADAACQSAAMDLLADAVGASTGTQGFAAGTDFSCAVGTGSTDATGCRNMGSNCPNAVPCWYARKNGYDGSGLTANTPSNRVSVSFPSSVPGVTTPPSAMTTVPFMRVDVTDRVQTYFSRLVTGSATQDVVATAKCGLVLANAPIPIVVLHPLMSSSLNKTGTSTIFILGGPQKSIQVNSQSNTAVVISGASGKIDLHLGGPAGTGSDIGVFSGEANPGSTKVLLGTTGNWIAPATAISDPFARVSAPTHSSTAAPSPIHVSYLTNGCPDYSNGCKEYQPGWYPNGIQVGGGSQETALFDPGVYYLGAPSTGSCRNNALCLLSNSTVRPSVGVTPLDSNNIGGSMFFLSGTNGISVAANSGSQVACGATFPSGCLKSFDTSLLACPGQSAPTIIDGSGTVITQLDGNVLTGVCSASGSYGDPTNAKYHGLLFFQDRSGSGATPTWGGGGQFILAGNMYFHYCNASGTGTGCDAANSTGTSGGETDVFSLSGGSGANAFILGEIVTDQLSLVGNSNIDMILNPFAAYQILKVELLQ